MEPRSLTPETGLPITPQGRALLGGLLAALGLVLYLLGWEPQWFGLDMAPDQVGLVQLLVFLIGLGLLLFGGIIYVRARWNGDAALPLRADLGLRLAATGYMFTVIAALADILGFGSHPNPREAYFGPWQLTGIYIGEGLMLAGFLLAWPWRRAWPNGRSNAQTPDSAPHPSEIGSKP
ncbi:MAG: hypothetical protein GXO36_04060 [Chloroflexi bacterium]|nr:hypothetical protein [Chloroflexota bacterium]